MGHGVRCGSSPPGRSRDSGCSNWIRAGCQSIQSPRPRRSLKPSGFDVARRQQSAGFGPSTSGCAFRCHLAIARNRAALYWAADTKAADTKNGQTEKDEIKTSEAATDISVRDASYRASRMSGMRPLDLRRCACSHAVVASVARDIGARVPVAGGEMSARGLAREWRACRRFHATVTVYGGGSPSPEQSNFARICRVYCEVNFWGRRAEG
jgi:hypothetical protein